MFIRQADLFQGVSTEAKGVIDRQKTKQSYKEGDIVFHEGEEAEYFYTLEEGKIDLFVGRQEEMHFLVFYPGEIFGWSALVQPHRYLAHAGCVTDCTVSRVPRQAIDDMVKEYPTDGLLIYKNLASVTAERLIAAYRYHEESEPKQVAYGW